MLTSLMKPPILTTQIEESSSSLSKPPLALRSSWQPPHNFKANSQGRLLPQQENPEKSSPQKRPQVLKAKTTSNLRSSRQLDLRRHSSKLHLIDDTTLTSLPFPPPAASKRLKRAASTYSCNPKNNQAATQKNQLQLSLNLSENVPEGHIYTEPVLYRQDTSGDGNIYNYGDETFDETFDESQDPIVLVEDYMTEVQSKEAIFRKMSLANIKERLREETSNTDVTSHLSSLSAPKEEDGKVSTSKFSTLGNEDLEAIFGAIPGAEKLKYCTLCDKPLYELSSALNHPEIIESPSKSSMSHHYQEFVCWDCIIAYEQILSELHEVEIKFVDEKRYWSSMNHRFSDTPIGDSKDCCHDKYLPNFEDESCAPTHAPKRRKFSNDLIGRLHFLSELSRPRENNKEWLTGWSEKLRLNLHNFLSNAFAPSEHGN